MRTELHVGVDAEKVVVSPYPMKARSGRLRRTRTGLLVEAVPRTPSGRTREQRVTFLARLALPLTFLSAVLGVTGVSWWLLAAGSVAVLGQVWRVQRRNAQSAALAVPRDSESRVLWTAPDRAAFEGALETARRVRATWPALAGMVDADQAGRSLTRALGELGEVLARRQELRRLRDELSAVRIADIPADSPARAAADEQWARAARLWKEEEATARRIVGSIDAAARSGECFIRERQVAATARYAEHALARVTGTPAAVESGPDLADRTAAVIAAYRDLAA